MKVSANYRLYDTFGGHQSISAIGAILEIDFPQVGTAIDELEIIVHFKQDGPPRKSLENSHAVFHENLASLPRCEFKRSKKHVLLSVEGTFTTGYEMHRKKRKGPSEIDPQWVRDTLATVFKAVPLVKEQLKKADDFDYECFEHHIAGKLLALPSSVDEISAIVAIVSARRKAAYAQLDEWEKLNIDWQDYAPQAREVVPLPFLWETTDDFAPNGNDAGADTLGHFREWNSNHKKQSALDFLSVLMKQWEIDPNDPYASELTAETYVQMVVGLAFASAKLRGGCERQLRELSLNVIDKYLTEVSRSTDWPHKDECILKLGLSRSVIARMRSDA